MSAVQSKSQLSEFNNSESGALWLQRSRAKSLGATLIEFGIALVDAECEAPTSNACLHCHGTRMQRNSTAQFSDVFCSQECEQEFIRTALAGLTLQDCIRMQRRLDTLLLGVEGAAV